MDTVSLSTLSFQAGCPQTPQVCRQGIPKLTKVSLSSWSSRHGIPELRVLQRQRSSPTALLHGEGRCGAMQTHADPEPCAGQSRFPVPGACPPTGATATSTD